MLMPGRIDLCLNLTPDTSVSSRLFILNSLSVFLFSFHIAMETLTMISSLIEFMLEDSSTPRLRTILAKIGKSSHRLLCALGNK